MQNSKKRIQESDGYLWDDIVWSNEAEALEKANPGMAQVAACFKSMPYLEAAEVEIPPLTEDELD
jgi:hypothetical protein